MKRRDLIKGLTILPLAGGVAPLTSMAEGALPATAGAVDGAAATGNIFQSIGVEPLINCRGTFTIIGGSLERPAVRGAMEDASKSFVQYDELADGIAKRLAELTQAEWGMVSAGCAAGLKHVTAACVTGGNPEKLIRIPDLTGFDKTEVVIPASARNVYDHAIRNIGVTVITVPTLEAMASALSDRTAMIYLLSEDEGPFTIEAVLKLAKPKNIPILVDAAAEDLTIPNIHLQKGASVVAYSGGKALCGPQCAGLLIGDKKILMSAWQASSPHHGPGRDNKVGREEMIGMMAAVEAWIKLDHTAIWKNWLSYLDTIKKGLAKVDGLTMEVIEPTGLSNKSPVLTISWDPAKLNITGEEVAEIVGRSKPRIALGGQTGRGKNASQTMLEITTGQMQPGQDKIVASRLYEVLTTKRSPKDETMKAPATDISGTWDADIEFYNSHSQQVLTIQQDGNWINGSHKSDFSTRDLSGTIEGDEVKLRSRYSRPGDGITFIFTGKLSGETIAGDIFMGEYRTAKFTAKKHTYKDKREPVVVPGGPPLAT